MSGRKLFPGKFAEAFMPLHQLSVPGVGSPGMVAGDNLAVLMTFVKIPGEPGALRLGLQ